MSRRRLRRVGVASLVQETNTFALKPSTLADFEAQGLATGDAAARALAGTNTEFAGGIQRAVERGAIPVPLVRAWAMSSGRLTADALGRLKTLLHRQLQGAGSLDGLVLSLHGALSAENVDAADSALLAVAREDLPSTTPIGVCLDLHANVNAALVELSDFLIGYHTYPHIDQAATGARVADLLLDRIEGRSLPVTAYAKRPLLIPAETQQTTDGPMRTIRQLADEAVGKGALDVSLFPVQPWLDVLDLGFAATASTDSDLTLAQTLADEFASLVWQAKESFVVDLVEPATALDRVRRSPRGTPFLLAESADSPTAGSAGDSPAMVGILLEHGRDLRSYVTVVDWPAVDSCFRAGIGGKVQLQVGCQIDRRFHSPVPLEGVVRNLGDAPVTLTGPVFTGMKVSMGRYAVVDSGPLSVLLSEQPACTFDPETFRSVGLRPEDADVVVVRSATLFRAGFQSVSRNAMILDLPGASTPRLASLPFRRATRPLYPLDASDWD